MRGTFLATCLVLLTAAPLLSAPPDAIRLPVVPSVPVPPTPTTDVSTLGVNQWYVIDSDVPLIVLASPAGLVKITEEVGPLRLKGFFADGTGKVETREYKGKHIVTVEALITGRVELLVIPVGATKVTDVIRRTTDVDAGQGPIPPPKPVPPDPKPPDPKPPDPKPPEPVTSFRVFLVYESSDNLTPAQRGVVFGKVVEDFLNANCTGGKTGWRRRDKDSPGETDVPMAALWAAIKPNVTVTPCVAVERNGKVELVNLEATPAKMVEVLTKYREGK